MTRVEDNECLRTRFRMFDLELKTSCLLSFSVQELLAHLSQLERELAQKVAVLHTRRNFEPKCGVFWLSKSATDRAQGP